MTKPMPLSEKTHRCAGCNQPIRPRGVLTKDAPGTVPRGAQGRCTNCYRARKKQGNHGQCRYGHELVAGNITWVDDKPKCRTCARERQRAHAKKNVVPVSFDGAAFDARHAVIEAPPRACCARCRRGTKQYASVDVCGLNGKCGCHG